MDLTRIKNTFTIPQEFVREFRRRNQQYTQTSALIAFAILAIALTMLLLVRNIFDAPGWQDARSWYLLAMVVLVVAVVVLLRLRISTEYLRIATIVSVFALLACTFCAIEATVAVAGHTALIDGSPGAEQVIYGSFDHVVFLLCMLAFIFIVRVDLRTTVILQGAVTLYYLVRSIMVYIGIQNNELIVEGGVVNFGDSIIMMVISCVLAMVGACIFSSVLIQSFMGEKNLEDLASCDALTRVHNRRGFDVMFNRVLQDARMTGATVSLLLVDIDKFKVYNDTYGHIEGDRCLAAVAKSITGSVRKNDFVARYGGEEFAVIMENTPREAAERAANQMLEDIRARHIRHEGSEFQVLTFSVGGVTFKASQLSSTDYYVKLADEALYNAKETGRNKVLFNRQSL